MEAAPEQGVPLFTIYEPLTDAGGDVFRCFRCADGSILFVLADVAGHSVISSYAVASFLGMLSTFVGECSASWPWPPTRSARPSWPAAHGCGRFGRCPCDPLPHLAMKLNHGIQSGPFAEVPVCVLLGRWTPATGRLQLLNAGIPHGLQAGAAAARTGPVRINGTPWASSRNRPGGLRAASWSPGTGSCSAPTASSRCSPPPDARSRTGHRPVGDPGRRAPGPGPGGDLRSGAEPRRRPDRR